MTTTMNARAKLRDLLSANTTLLNDIMHLLQFVGDQADHM